MDYVACQSTATRTAELPRHSGTSWRYWGAHWQQDWRQQCSPWSVGEDRARITQWKPQLGGTCRGSEDRTGWFHGGLNCVKCHAIVSSPGLLHDKLQVGSNGTPYVYILCMWYIRSYIHACVVYGRTCSKQSVFNFICTLEEQCLLQYMH